MKTIQLKPPENVDITSAEGAMEGARRATGIAPSAEGPGLKTKGHGTPDPEVSEKIFRRKHTAKYKLRILEKADTCTQPGEIGALLRREGLYSSNLTTWRRQRETGQLQALNPKKRGRKEKEINPLTNRVSELEKKTGGFNRNLKRPS